MSPGYSLGAEGWSYSASRNAYASSIGDYLHVHICPVAGTRWIEYRRYYSICTKPKCKLTRYGSFTYITHHRRFSFWGWVRLPSQDPLRVGRTRRRPTVLVLTLSWLVRVFSCIHNHQLVVGMGFRNHLERPQAETCAGADERWEMRRDKERHNGI